MSSAAWALARHTHEHLLNKASREPRVAGEKHRDAVVDLPGSA